MTDSTPKTPVRHSSRDAPTPTPLEVDTHRPIRNAGITAGIGILIIAALAGFGKFIVVNGVVTRGDATHTAPAIIESEGLFRLGIISLVVVVALDIVVAWALYRVFTPVSTGISLLSAWFRIVYAGVFLVAAGHLAAALRLLGNDDYLAVFRTDQLQAQALLEITTFGDVWHAGLFLFGVHLLILSCLAYRSSYVPGLLGVLLAVAGLGYMIDSVGAILLQGAWADVSSFTFIGEFLLALWLLIRARHLTIDESTPHHDPTPVPR